MRDLQQHFCDNLIAKHVDSVFLNLLQEKKGLSTLRSFNIYANNRRISLLTALANTYPVCQKLVGKPYFERMAYAYLEQYPSFSPSLNDYGFALAEALLGSHFVLDLPYLIDMIRLEWHIHCILTGTNEVLFDWSKLSLIPSAQYADLIFYRSTNSILMHSPFPVDRIWETNQDDFSGNDNVDLTEGEVYLFIGRRFFDIRIDRFSTDQWIILSAIDGKRSLKDLQIALAGKLEEHAMIENLPTLIQAGYIAKFDLKSNLN